MNAAKQTLVLEAHKREPKVNTDTLRKEGKIPAVFYGPKIESTPIALDNIDFMKAWEEAGESGVISLDVDGSKVDVLIHDIAYHPVTQNPIHADFYVIDKDKKVEVSVPLVFEGEAPAVNNLGGTLVKVLHEITIEGLPHDLPHEVAVNLGVLSELDSVIAIKDLPLPTGIEATQDPDETVAAISVQEEEPEEETSEGPDLESIEVEKKGKEEDESSEE